MPVRWAQTQERLKSLRVRSPLLRAAPCCSVLLLKRTRCERNNDQYEQQYSGSRHNYERC